MEFDFSMGEFMRAGTWLPVDGKLLFGENGENIAKWRWPELSPEEASDMAAKVFIGMRLFEVQNENQEVSVSFSPHRNLTVSGLTVGDVNRIGELSITWSKECHWFILPEIDMVAGMQVMSQSEDLHESSTIGISLYRIPK